MLISKTKIEQVTWLMMNSTIHTKCILCYSGCPLLDQFFTRSSSYFLQAVRSEAGQLNSSKKMELLLLTQCETSAWFDCDIQHACAGGCYIIGHEARCSRSVWTVGKALPALDTIVSVPHPLHQLPSLPLPTNSRSNCYFVLTSQTLLSGTIERIMPSIVTRQTGDEPIMFFR